MSEPVRIGVSRVVERVLVGGSPETPEARIRIGSGVLAGAEFRLSAVGGQVAIEARLLTATAGSRQTLAMAIDEVARRLRARTVAQVPSGSGAATVVRRGPGADTARRGR